MALADEIRDLADRVLRDLRSSRDFYEHTKASWRVTQEFGHAGHPLDIRDTETNVVLSATALDELGQHYVRVPLAQSTFKDLASLLEDWVFGLLELWLLAYPKGIPNKKEKQVPLIDIVDAADKDAIIRGVVGRELRSIAYRRPSEWFEYLAGRVELGCPTDDQIKDLAEIKASRDVLVHNRGIANRAYLDKAGDRARFTDGDLLDVPEPYLHASLRLVHGVVEDMAARAITKAT